MNQKQGGQQQGGQGQHQGGQQQGGHGGQGQQHGGQGSQHGGQQGGGGQHNRDQASSKVAPAKSISASAIRNMIARRDEICPRLAGGFSYTWTLAGAIGTNPRPFLCGLRFVQLVAPCSVAVASVGASYYPIY
jgi:hypothetical protein